jgi:hypothetical protein
VTLDSVVNYICVDPIDGMKVWGGDSAKETEAHSYDSIADLMENCRKTTAGTAYQVKAAALASPEI